MYIITRFFAGFQEWEAADMAGISHDKTHRVFYEASIKMAHNLGYHRTFSHVLLSEATSAGIDKM